MIAQNRKGWTEKIDAAKKRKQTILWQTIIAIYLFIFVALLLFIMHLM